MLPFLRDKHSDSKQTMEMLQQVATKAQRRATMPVSIMLKNQQAMAQLQQQQSEQEQQKQKQEDQPHDVRPATPPEDLEQKEEVCVRASVRMVAGPHGCC
jgi:hypothetical protein